MYNFVEKAEDNISNWERTLEKDKKDQSKYYLSYPKLPILNMKWENRDINVVEWANIPKFPLLLNVD